MTRSTVGIAGQQQRNPSAAIPSPARTRKGVVGPFEVIRVVVPCGSAVFFMWKHIMRTGPVVEMSDRPCFGFIGCMCGCLLPVKSAEGCIQRGGQVPLAAEPDELFDDLAVLEEHDRGDGTDLKTG